MEQLKLFFRLYLEPAAAMSDIIDRGSWLFGAVAVLVVSGAFAATIDLKLTQAYRGAAVEVVRQNAEDAPPAAPQTAEHERVPVVGDRFFDLFQADAAAFYQPLLLISIFYVPASILLMCLFGDVGSFGLILRRDYGPLAVCTLYGWAAANLPFAVLGLAVNRLSMAPTAYLALWAASGLLFGTFMIFALRTVFGANYGAAVVVVAIAWLSLSLGLLVFRHVSPWLFSPFLLFYALMYLGGSIGGEVRGFGNALRQRQNLKRFLHNATVNPRDADAHVQLGLIYLQRRQDAKAVEHLERALEIDRTEIDANYELGKLARSRGELQKALDHFAIVLEQNDKHALSEIWREIGATYLAAGMLDEAKDALEKFVERRAGDPEGLYYLGKVLKAKGDVAGADDMFNACIDYAKASPDFRRHRLKQWSKLAQKEL